MRVTPGGVSVSLDNAAIEEFLNNPYDVVGDLMLQLADKGAMIARGLAPVREHNVWNETTSSGALNARTAPGGVSKPPGYTKARIHGKRGVSRGGNLYGSVNAPADPAIFMEYPASQLHHKRPFLTTALWSITVE